VARWLRRRGKGFAQAADLIGIRPATLRAWLASASRTPAPSPRPGRPRVTIARPDRQRAIAALDRRAACGVGTLRRHMPALGRNAAGQLVRRHHFLRSKRRRRRLCQLQWHLPGTVWAMDGTWLPHPLLSGARQALTVVDLGSRKVLAVEPIPGEQAAAVVVCLAALVARFGAPLVLKCDNGAGFIAEPVRRFCEAHQIALMHSPPRQPSYNGACEAHNRWSKDRIRCAALAAGREDVLLPEDLAAACTWQGTTSAVTQQLRDAFRDRLAAELRTALAARGLAQPTEASQAVRRSLERVAIRRALEQCHILTIRGRDFRWQ